jgi:uncharacterized protein
MAEYVGVYSFYKGDSDATKAMLSQVTESMVEQVVGDSKLLIIDEAQMIPNIGAFLKLLVDTRPDIAVVITGSSALDLAGQTGEPLTGRKLTKYVFPLSVVELVAHNPTPKALFSEKLEQLLIYGSYPECILLNDTQQKREYLDDLLDSYVFKDILTLSDVKGSRVLVQLVAKLAFQVGSLVSTSELGASLGLDAKTVARYLDLLEKSFIIFRLGGFSRNLRKEITKQSKYYFYDLGVRNAVISNYNRLELRNDVGQLWENFVILERLKKRKHLSISANQYFWRTWSGQEIDLVEEREGLLYGYEVKWSDKIDSNTARTIHKSSLAPKLWTETYQNEQKYELINRSNFLDFLS